jgi:hypothetical protein
LNNQIITHQCFCRAWDVPTTCQSGNQCCSLGCPREVQCPRLCPDDIGLIPKHG